MFSAQVPAGIGELAGSDRPSRARRVSRGSAPVLVIVVRLWAPRCRSSTSWGAKSASRVRLERDGSERERGHQQPGCEHAEAGCCPTSSPDSCHVHVSRGGRCERLGIVAGSPLDDTTRGQDPLQGRTPVQSPRRPAPISRSSRRGRLPREEAPRAIPRPREVTATPTRRSHSRSSSASSSAWAGFRSRAGRHRPARLGDVQAPALAVVPGVLGPDIGLDRRDGVDRLLDGAEEREVPLLRVDQRRDDGARQFVKEGESGGSVLLVAGRALLVRQAAETFAAPASGRTSRVRSGP